MYVVEYFATIKSHVALVTLGKKRIINTIFLVYFITLYIKNFTHTHEKKYRLMPTLVISLWWQKYF